MALHDVRVLGEAHTNLRSNDEAWELIERLPPIKNGM